MVLGYCPVCDHEIRQKDFYNGEDYECPNCNHLPMKCQLVGIVVMEAPGGLYVEPHPIAQAKT